MVVTEVGPPGLSWVRVLPSRLRVLVPSPQTGSPPRPSSEAPCSRFVPEPTLLQPTVTWHQVPFLPRPSYAVGVEKLTTLRHKTSRPYLTFS